jgi:hypothetical protein
MKNTILIFLLAFSIKTIGQVKTDTIYLYFKHSKHEIFGQGNKKNGKILSYIYKFNFNNKLNDFILTTVQTNDSLGFKRKAEIKWVNKKFIRKNKLKVYDIKKMQQKGFTKTLDEIGLNCIIYLIDIKIKKNNKFKAREVEISFPEII